MLKKNTVLALALVYIFIIYLVFWIKTDDVSSVQRLNHYVGTIVKFECRMGGRKNAHEIINLRLDSGSEIEFYYPNVRSCRSVRKAFPIYEGLVFNGYFMARSVMKITIGDVILYDFISQKRNHNMFYLGVMVFPFFCYLAVFLVKQHNNRGQAQ
jgi:hypothetical protein